MWNEDGGMSTAVLIRPQNGFAVAMRDYSELVKARVTTLVIATAACGFYLGARKGGFSSLSWQMLAAMIGVGLVSGGTAALNEVMERDVDSRMQRTARRPLPSGRMSLAHGTAVGLLMTLGGSAYLGLTTNWLTGAFALLTATVYLAIYTPLKQVSPICTTIGAFPGAMPGVLGWTAARGRLDLEALVLFAIVFFWQFPHFFAIAWLYREDYARGGVRMMPVVENDGRRTSRRILFYSIALIPVSMLPFFVRMSGTAYLAGAFVLGISLLYFGLRLTQSRLQPSPGLSKKLARQLLQASVIYLPLLFALMMVNTARP
jgi:protoheme IX farnesyltransferase